MAEEQSSFIKKDNDMIRPLNEEQAKELMAELTRRENEAIERGDN